MSSVKTKVSLVSNLVVKKGKKRAQRQFFSLSYRNLDGKKMYLDLSGIRPDPRDYLKGDKQYLANIIFEKKYIEGSYVDFPRKLVIDENTFFNIR